MGVYITKDGVLHSHRRENLTAYNENYRFKETGS
jgi:hypothetical protein